MKILLIDDSKKLRHSLKNILFDIPGVKEIFECSCGGEALEHFQRHAPDTVILDIHLGDITGFKVLEKLKRISLQLKVIIFTAHPYPQYLEKARLLGADYFIDKSFSNELIEVIEKMIKSKTISNQGNNENRLTDKNLVR